MKLLVYAIAITLTLGTALYTFNFGVWAWKKGYKRGGIGVWLLAGLTVAFPLFMLFLLPR